MVHQKESKAVIRYTQTIVKENPRMGFWMISGAAFLLSPFLTNDGVCLLFVEPILNAFESIDDCDGFEGDIEFKLRKSDAMFFLLSLACSSNIGSALTYTGNPQVMVQIIIFVTCTYKNDIWTQNMIVGGDAIEVLSPIRFLLYMIFPSVSVFFITILWIERCWMRERMLTNSKDRQVTTERTSAESTGTSLVPLDTKPLTLSTVKRKDASRRPSLLSPYKKEKIDQDVSFDRISDKREKQGIVSKVVRVIITPFPYAMLLLMAVMIALIFVDVMSISGLICLTAVVMVVILVLGNHWQGQPIWGIANDGANGDYSTPHKMTTDEKIANTNSFFEELFESIDYNLLIIFLGLFVVVENIDSTGLPRNTWNKIVGKAPFDNITSVVGISLFVLATSQFLGNVAVIQLAKPNVEILDEGERRYAWAVISFVATVGGNLTITGSAANIIVAEKASRIDPANTIDFFKHYKVCFWVTLFSCALGATMITGVVICDNGGLVAW